MEAPACPRCLSSLSTPLNLLSHLYCRLHLHLRRNLMMNWNFRWGWRVDSGTRYPLTKTMTMHFRSTVGNQPASSRQTGWKIAVVEHSQLDDDDDVTYAIESMDDAQNVTNDLSTLAWHDDVSVNTSCALVGDDFSQVQTLRHVRLISGSHAQREKYPKSPIWHTTLFSISCASHNLYIYIYIYIYTDEHACRNETDQQRHSQNSHAVFLPVNITRLTEFQSAATTTMSGKRVSAAEPSSRGRDRKLGDRSSCWGACGPWCRGCCRHVDHRAL